MINSDNHYPEENYTQKNFTIFENNIIVINNNNNNKQFKCSNYTNIYFFK